MWSWIKSISGEFDMNQFVGLMLGYWTAYNRYQLTLQELCSLDDRDLADIGISRVEIPSVALDAWRKHLELVQDVD
jgi:uncharacterized protein YjiS (DUF1127 family)